MHDILKKRQRPHVLDEKSIPASKIEVSWAIGDSVLTAPHSVPYLIPTRFLLSS